MHRLLITMIETATGAPWLTFLDSFVIGDEVVDGHRIWNVTTSQLDALGPALDVDGRVIEWHEVEL